MIIVPVYKGRSNFASLIAYLSCVIFCGNHLYELFEKRYATYFELR